MTNDLLPRFRVTLFIRGSVSRPCYDGYIDIVAPSEDEAPDRAIRELRRTTYPDVMYEAFRVDGVERIG